MKPKSRPTDQAGVLEKIAAMPANWIEMAGRIHALVLRAAPSLQPSLWYGMPAYTKDGKTVCFFRADKKYVTFGLTQDANLAREKGATHQLLSTAWCLTVLDEATETRLSEIVRLAAE